MAKLLKRLNAKSVETIKEPGWYPDGGGLYLQVSPTCSKSWVYRYKLNGRERRKGLGSYSMGKSLSEAREDAKNDRSLLDKKIDPIEHQRKIKHEQALDEAKTITFKECALAYIDSHKEGWKNAKHESQWRNTLETYAYPVMGDLPVQGIDIGIVLEVLEPIWYDKTETASRVRQRMENILDWAIVREYREDANPARWKGRLDKILPNRNKVKKPVHFAAMDYRQLPEYFRSLRKRETIAAKALAFTILTATRNGEARAATRAEIDFKEKVWIIPDSRMKADKEHRVPLSAEALAIIKEMEVFKRSTDDYIFPGFAKDKPISEAALLKIVKKHDDTLTVHGFRSAFRDWCAEQTSYPREIAESALAHTLKDKTEAAYQRGDLIEKRRRLMDQWADYCLTGQRTGEVIPISKSSHSG